MDIEAMLNAMSEEKKEKLEARRERTKKLGDILLPEGEGERMHAMSIRWTMFEVASYCDTILGNCPEEISFKYAQMVRDLTDFLVENYNVENKHRVPGAAYFKTLVSVKDLSDE